MAIIYTYPNLPLSSLSAEDLLVITNVDATNNNPTKSVTLADIATYITNTGTGSGTTNTLTLWSDGPSGLLGDSILTQDVGATAITVTGNLISTGTGNFTGQVTIPATPVATTDAASKNYVDTEVAGIPAGLVFKGNWNANTNTPTLTSGVGTVGNYYVVSVAGNTDLDGITDWQVGDWAVFVEVGGVDKWDKIDQTFVSGSGVAGQVTFWNTINTVDGDSNFLWDNTNKRLGVGSVSPTEKLQVYESGTTALKTYSTTNAGAILVAYQSTSGSPYTKTTDIVAGSDGTVPSEIRLITRTAGESSLTERMRIDSSGNVGIGTTSPANGKLNVFSNGSSDDVLRINADDARGASRYALHIIDSDPNSRGSLKIATTSGASITTTNAVGIGTDSPDRALEVENSSGIGSMVLTGTTGSTLYFRPTVSYSPGGNFGILVTGGSGPEFLSTMKFSGYNTSSGGVNTIMTLKGDGNVGIGTTSPANKLEVNGNIAVNQPSGGNAGIKIITDAAAEGFLIFGDPADNSMGGFAYNNSTNSLSIDCNNAERILIDSSGNVGIGTSPSSKLHVAGDITFGDSHFIGDDSFDNLLILSSSGENIVIQAPSGNSIDLKTAGGSTLNLDSSQNATFAGKVNVAGSTNNESSLNVRTQSGSIGSIGFETASEVTGIISSNTDLMEFRVGDGIGISSAKQLKIDTGGIEVTGDIEVTNSSDGLILKSPDGTRYRVTVANGGTLSVSAV